MTKNELLLQKAIDAQTDFWDALTELESSLGVEIDGADPLDWYQISNEQIVLK